MAGSFLQSLSTSKIQPKPQSSAATLRENQGGIEEENFLFKLD